MKILFQAALSVVASPTERIVPESIAVTGSGWVLLSSHQPGALVTPSQLVALGSKAQETRPGLTPKAVPIGELAGSMGLKGGWTVGAAWAWARGTFKAVSAAAPLSNEVLRKSLRE